MIIEGVKMPCPYIPYPPDFGKHAEKGHSEIDKERDCGKAGVYEKINGLWILK